MSESEVATKAPESDAMESQAALSSESEPQTQPKLAIGEHCTTDRPVPVGHQSSGEITKFDDIEVYISKPADYPNSPGKLLLLLTSGTGVHSVNNQLQADAFAKEGYLVVMPDQFSGDSAPNASNVEEELNSPSIIEQIKLGFASSAKSFIIDMWLARHTEEKVLPIIHKTISFAKDEYADAVANGGGIYAAGYCFGAKYVIILAGEGHAPSNSTENKVDKDEKPSSTQPLIKAGAVAHPTMVTREDLKRVKVPLSLACVGKWNTYNVFSALMSDEEQDPLFPDEILEFGKKCFASTSVDHEVKIFPGVPHVFGDYSSDKIKDAQTTAFSQMLNWLRKF